MRKVSAGDPLNIPAKTFNTFVDAAQDYIDRSHNTNRDGDRHGFTGVVVPVKNTTGGDLSRFAVVRLDGPPFTYAENAAGFVNLVAFKGKKAAAGESGLIAVYQDPAPSGEYARAMIHGVTAVLVTFPDADTIQFADLAEDETGKLKANTSAGAEILYTEALGASFPVDKIAYIRLSTSPGRNVGVFELQAGGLEQGDKAGVLAKPMEWDDSASDWIVEGTAGGGTAVDDVTIYGNIFQGVAWGTTIEGGTKTGDRVTCIRAKLADKWFAIAGGHTMAYGTLGTDAPTAGGGSSGETAESLYEVSVGVPGGVIKVEARNSLGLSLSDSDVVYLHWDSGAGIRNDTLLDGRSDSDFVSKGHWDIIAVDSDDGGTTVYGCGLASATVTDGTTGEDTTTVIVDVSDLDGDGLTTNTVGDACELVVATGCGLEIVAEEVAFAAAVVAGAGLVVNGACTIDVNAGCGIEIVGDAVRVKAADLAGDALSVSGDCELNVNAGCGLAVNAANGLEVSPADLAGCGLQVSGTDCELEVKAADLAGDGLSVSGDCTLNVTAGCGLAINAAGSVEVVTTDLAGDGLGTAAGASGCEIYVIAGCGLQINAAGGVEVAAADLAGNGLTASSSGCALDIDCSWIVANCEVGGGTGAQGPQGVPGAAGPQGAQGHQGDTGATGPCPTLAVDTVTTTSGGSAAVSITESGACAYDFDFTIPKGDQGDAGATGPTGPAGPQGVPGATGPAGPQGADGATGPAGPQGVPGAAGPQGAQGHQGDTGAAGPPGPQGPQGFQGAAGPQGFQGAAGAAGAAGPQGAAGAAGPQGAAGAAGPQGAAGAAGPQGAPGATGPQGVPGANGANGAPGADGVPGPQGPPGDKMAIVPAAGEHVALFCVEAPDIRFEDTVRVPLSGKLTVLPVDAVFAEVCERGTVEAVSIITPRPADVGAFVAGGVLTIEVSGDVPAFAIVRLSGIRKGRGGVRFPVRTADEMKRNNEFWSRAIR